MYDRNQIRDEDSGIEQSNEQATDRVDEQANERGRRRSGERSSGPGRERFTVRNAIEGVEELLAGVACTERGEELRPTVELERQGRIDYDWGWRANLGHPEGRTLAEEERQLAEEQELVAQRERAMAAVEAGVNRERSACVQTEVESEERVREFRERGVLGSGGDPSVDARERVDAETVGAVNRAGATLAKRFRGPSRAAFAKQVAEKVACQGLGVTAAVLRTKADVAKGVDALQPIGSIESWMGDPRYQMQANVEGVVRTLYEPAASNQQQVGVIEDESGTAKLTIWKRSNIGCVLSEGDRVRLLNLEVGWYGGRASLAATSRTTVTVLERGSGPSPMN